MELVLYQYEVCPFCCKVKGYLDARGVPYRTVEVNPLLKSEIKFSKDYRKVPIVLIDGEQFNDSSAIIDEIERRIAAANPAAAKAGGGWFGKTGTSGKAAPAEEVAARRKWVDDHLVHLLPPNIYLTPAEALRSFEYVTEKGNFGTFARYAAKYTGAAAMYAISGKLKKKYGIVNEREELYAAADDFANAVGDDRPFHGGDAPDLADMAVFGVLRAIQLIGADTWQDLQAHSRIGPWFARMQAAAPSARVAAD
jgi:microsomal prostaglandin-E synthase 2